jgi:hypothetical protein
MKFSDLLDIQFRQIAERHSGNPHWAGIAREKSTAFMQDFGVGAAVFIADKLAFFGDVGAARHEARNIVSNGHSRSVVRVRRVVLDTTIGSTRLK